MGARRFLRYRFRPTAWWRSIVFRWLARDSGGSSFFAMLALPIVESPMREALFTEAVDLYRRARRVGLTVRSSVDCLIAACAIRHDLEVLHSDRDYPALARVSELRQRPLSGRGRG